MVLLIVYAIIKVEERFSGAEELLDSLAPESHIHPDPEHDQKRGIVTFRASPHHPSYKLLLLKSDSEDPDVLDSIVNDGTSESYSLKTNGSYESIQLNLVGDHNVSMNDETYQMATTKTTNRNHKLSAESPTEEESVILKNESNVETFDYRNGDSLTFSNLSTTDTHTSCESATLSVRLFINTDTLDLADPIEISPGETYNVVINGENFHGLDQLIQQEGQLQVLGKSDTEFNTDLGIVVE